MTVVDRFLVLIIIFGIGYLIYEKFVNGNNPMAGLKDGTRKLFSRDKLR